MCNCNHTDPLLCREAEKARACVCKCHDSLARVAAPEQKPRSREFFDPGFAAAPAAAQNCPRVEQGMEACTQEVAFTDWCDACKSTVTRPASEPPNVEPCPLCDCKVFKDRFEYFSAQSDGTKCFSYRCPKCRSQFAVFGKSEAEAMARWNTRVPDVRSDSPL